MYRRFLRILLCCVLATTAEAALASDSLPAPVLVSPAEQARLHGFPRTVVFEWSTVPGAEAYGIEINYYWGQWNSQAGKPTFMQLVKDPTFTFDFFGNQPGSWRVWAVDKHARHGQVSAWSLFSFGPDNQPIHPPPPGTAPDFTRLPARPDALNRLLPQGKMRDLPVSDPKTGENCTWPPTYAQGITMPKGVYTPEPAYTDAVRAAKANGSVQLAVDLGADGLAKRVCVLRASRDDLGQQAVDTVRTWRFEPAKKDGAAIPYSVSVEVTFYVRN
jgi:TonB family protein